MFVGCGAIRRFRLCRCWIGLCSGVGAGVELAAFGGSRVLAMRWPGVGFWGSWGWTLRLILMLPGFLVGGVLLQGWVLWAGSRLRLGGFTPLIGRCLVPLDRLMVRVWWAREPPLSVRRSVLS